VNKSYAHAPYEKFYIRDPKVRPIHKSSVRDRVVHHAVFKVLNEIFEPSFIFDSYSCRINKGTHRAVLRLKKFSDAIYAEYSKCFVLKCDIKKFFHSIDHEILLKLVWQKIKNDEIMRVVKILIDSFRGNLIGERERERESKGCPIGNLTSQLFANIYLNELDQFIKSTLKVRHYIRYTDDFVIAHHNPEYLLSIKEEIAQFLNVNLKMELHPSKVVLRKYHAGVDFLGYVLLPRAILLRTKTKRRMFKKVRKRILDYKREVISEQQLMQTINSYLAVLSHANSFKLRRELMHMIWTLLRSPEYF